MRKYVYVQYYSVDWLLSNGFCYRTTNGMKWDDVLQAKKTARLLGERIRYEKTHKVRYDYTI